MQFLVLLAVLALVAAAPVELQDGSSSSHVEELQWKIGGGCNRDSKTVNGVTFAKSECTKTAIWKVRINDLCTISEYKKETNSTTEPGVTFGPLNGIAQCTKTPCDAIEKITTDCATAFGDKLAQIEN